MQVQRRTALEILVNTWCENAETFQGFWASRISALALSQLFLSDRQSLQKLTVKGDIIVKPETQNGETNSFYFHASHRLCFHQTKFDPNGT